MNLDTINKSLEVKIGGSVSLNQLTWTSHYTDVDQTSIAITAISELDGLTNNTSAITMVAAPGVGKTRKITEITIENTDTLSQIVTVQLNDNGTKQPIVVIGLASGSTLQYSGSWSIIPSPGGTIGPQGIQGIQGIQGLPGSPILIDGEQGEDGLIGPVGIQGIQGIVGSPGLPILIDGEQGEDGLFGPPGIPGPIGAYQNPRVTSITSSATPTPNCDTTDAFDITALAVAAAFGAPTGTPVNFQKLLIRIKDNATPRAITWNAAYVAGGSALPTTTVTSKIVTILFMYNTANTLNKWQCVAVSQEA